MFCKYCGKEIDNDSTYCKFCGRKIKNKIRAKTKNTKSDTPISNRNEKNGTYIAPDGKAYKVRNGIMYDKDDWDVGRVPGYWSGDW